MNGIILKEKLQAIEDVQLVEVSKKLQISPQGLQNRFKSKDVSLDFIIQLAEAVNKSVYYFIEDTEYEKYFNGGYDYPFMSLQEEKATYNTDREKLLQAKDDIIALLKKENEALTKDKELLAKLLLKEDKA